MRKVNLRNVDPAIDDPDASTWCKSSLVCFNMLHILSTFTPSLAHPTLNRHSPPEVVANFKRRVPPRLPKPRKRDVQDHASIPRTAMGIGPVPLTVPSSVANHNKLVSSAVSGRARGFSLPSSMAPLNQGNTNGWGNNYNRSALPPLMVPSDPPEFMVPTYPKVSNGIYPRLPIPYIRRFAN
jgi:hypothetical protein